ncbi:MAG: S41 family peptidase [Octadecabacter sp.]|nr:S41 family peptidase [Octadecabacter sp.]
MGEGAGGAGVIIWGALRWLLRAILITVFVIGASWPLFSPPADQRGVWVTEGYGLVLDVGRFEFSAYQVGNGYCLPYFHAPAHSLILGEAGGLSMARSGEALVLTVEGVANPITATRATALPATCTPPVPGAQATAQQIFDVFHAAMDAHYPFFDLYGIDWAERATTVGTAPDALWQAMTAALAGLNDPHTYIYNGSRFYSAASGPEWHDNVRAYTDVIRNRGLTAIPDTGIEYARLPGGIGYVFLRHTDTNPGLLTAPEDIAISAFEQVSDALQGTNAVIIDNRLNPGGSDTVALAFARFFTAAPQLAFTKQTRTLGGYTAPFEASVQPLGSLTQPVYLLNSSFTASAAEVLTLALKDQPQVTVLGEPTRGAFSDIMDLRLPNGWVLGLSHQEYFGADGVQYEGTGIAPDEATPFPWTAFDQGQDPQLDRLLARLR